MTIGAERFGEEQFTVSSCCAAQNIKVDARIGPTLVELAKRGFGDIERLALVVCVERIKQVAVFIDEGELRGGRT